MQFVYIQDAAIRDAAIIYDPQLPPRQDPLQPKESCLTSDCCASVYRTGTRVNYNLFKSYARIPQHSRQHMHMRLWAEIPVRIDE